MKKTIKLTEKEILWRTKHIIENPDLFYSIREELEKMLNYGKE